MPDKIHQVVVIGAGPYGLAAANRLRREGFDVKVFGEPMIFWERNMPKGMFLRSSRDASNIGELHGPLTIDAYEKAKGITVTKPTPLTDFIDYGRWFQQTAIPDLDNRHVTRVSPNAHGFDLTLQDGEMMQATRVMVATGLDRFTRRPKVYANVSPLLVSHAAEHDDLGVFDGKSVVVIGGGQSALETSAILHESGASVELLARGPANSLAVTQREAARATSTGAESALRSDRRRASRFELDCGQTGDLPAHAETVAGPDGIPRHPPGRCGVASTAIGEGSTHDRRGRRQRLRTGRTG